MKKRIIIFIMLGAAFFLTHISSCKKKSESPLTPTYTENISDSDLEDLLSLPEDTNVNFGNMIFSDGTLFNDFLPDFDIEFNTKWLRTTSGNFGTLTQQEALKVLIKQMGIVAAGPKGLTIRKHYTFNGMQPNGLSYCYGSHDHMQLTTPKDGKCPPTHGLDCSGFIYQLFYQAGGISFATSTAEYERQTANLQNAIQSAIPSLQIIATDIGGNGSIPHTQWQSGDIIWWPSSDGKAAHIGMIFQGNNGHLAIFHSAGGPGSCDKNMSANGGPIGSPVIMTSGKTGKDAPKNGTYWFNRMYNDDWQNGSGTYHIVRMTTIDSSNNGLLKIGDSYQGGLIAYLLQPGDVGYDPSVQHGIIAAPSDHSTSLKWYNGTLTITGATGKAIGTGKANTDAIIASQGAGNYAASICRSLSLGGYTDWYLPSKDELNELNNNSTKVNFYKGINYWSSTEVDKNSALNLGYSSGYGLAKYHTCRVRAVRSF